MVRLMDVTVDNWRQVAKLKTAESQKGFVAPNSFSLAQAHYMPNCKPLAIYCDDTPVGFCMHGLDPDGSYWIIRLMIDENHQSRGYGRSAMELLLEVIKRESGSGTVYLSFEPENVWGKALYESLGFVPDGRIEDGEIVYKLEY